VAAAALPDLHGAHQPTSDLLHTCEQQRLQQQQQQLAAGRSRHQQQQQQNL
jgi:hypothetical protein